MKLVVDPTSKEFLWRAELIARSEHMRADALLYDVWFDYFLWKRRLHFEGGVVSLLGDFPFKSETLLASFAKVTRIINLDRLSTIPQAYGVLLDYADQAYVRHHFFNEFSRHFAKSRTPPQILVLGRYLGKDTPAGHVLTVAPAGPDAVEIKLAGALSDSFRVVGGSISMPPAALSQNAPYLMFGAQIQFTAIG